MHTPDQSPEEMQEKVQEQASQPLYEFSAGSSSVPNMLSAEEQKIAGAGSEVSQHLSSAEKSGSEAHVQHLPPEDLIRLGLVYPPPPSFYQYQQNAAESVQPPVSPVSAPSPIAGYPVTGAPEPRGPEVRQAPVKKSYKWIWIIVSIGAVLLFGSCGFCGWAFYTFFADAMKPATDTLVVADKYYAALQDKDYATAYSFIEPQKKLNGMTLEDFTTQAQDADSQYGTVRSYRSATGTYGTSSSTGIDLSSFTIIMNVTRADQSYNVLLTLQKTGSSWKIIDFDRV